MPLCKKRLPNTSRRLVYPVINLLRQRLSGGEEESGQRLHAVVEDGLLLPAAADEVAVRVHRLQHAYQPDFDSLRIQWL